MRFMNFQHLAQKYIKDANFVMHDRTYEGLEWHGPGEKPTMDFFLAAQSEEDREERKKGHAVEIEASQMQEKQAQAAAQAELESRSFEEKAAEETKKIKAVILEQKKAAIQARHDALLREEMLDSWREISASQAIINSKADEYLKSTDWYVTRKHETGEDIPEDVLQRRAKAREQISHGTEVFTHYQALRSAEMPSRDEIQKAIKAGGEHLEKIRETVKGVKLKYPKPRSII